MARLPPIPVVDPGLLTLYDREHALLEAERSRVDPAVDRLFRRFALSMTAQGVAGIPPSWQGGSRPELLPVPRAFLSATEVAKVKGVHAALQYVDSRLAMAAQGHDPYSFRPESPFVLHALTEGRMDNPSVTNPGMIRATPVWERSQRYIYPEAADVRPLFEEAIRTAMYSSAPACVVASWLLNTTIYLHPFCDANGRVGWLLYLLLAGRDSPHHFDLGAGEYWPIRKHALIAARGPARVLDEIDEGPVVSLVLRTSADGATWMRKRLQFLAAAFEQLARTGGRNTVDATVALAVTIRRIASADELATDLGVSYDQAIESLQAAAGSSLLRRVRCPPSRRTEGPPRPAFALSAAATDAVVSVLARFAA